MNTAAVAPLRYILTPTVKEEYDADEAGYSAAADEPKMEKLSLENDQVSGLEHLYGYILNHRERPSINLGLVTGEEGFFDLIKDGVTSLIETVKKFFKWIWSFFGSKSAAAEVRSKSLQERVRDHGVKDEEIPYPKTVLTIYPKPGKLEGNINWLSDVLTSLGGNVDKVGKYIKLVEEYCTKTQAALKGDGDYTAVREALEKGVKELFKPDSNGKIAFGRNERLSFDEKTGKISLNSIQEPNDRRKGAKFRTTQSQVDTLLTAAYAERKRLDELTKDITTLENPMVKALDDTLAQAKAANEEEAAKLRKGNDIIKEVVRVAMNNINVMETELYREYLAVLDIFTACVRK